MAYKEVQENWKVGVAALGLEIRGAMANIEAMAMAMTT